VANNFIVKNGLDTPVLTVAGSTLTSNAAALNILNGVTASTAELNYSTSLTSNLQTQIDNLTVTQGTLTKSFASLEDYTISLSNSVSPAPIVSAFKLIPSGEFTSKLSWDVDTDGYNYELHDTAYDTTLTPGIIIVDLSSASYDSVSFSVTSQDTFPQSITFNSDGTKMYIVGEGNDTIFQYSLSTAFDLSTASYDSVSLDVSSQDTQPTHMNFNDVGTKLYLLGNNNNSLFQYTLSTAYDISTASYDSVSFSVATQTTAPQGFTFNNDGTKMYIVENASDSVFQYTLSTAFDISTTSYDSVSLDVSSQDASPTGIVFNPAGTQMFLIGIGSDAVYQYTLSTAYDLSTASYDSVSFSVASQDTIPGALSFNNDYTKMYVVGNSNDSLFQYTVSSSEALLLGSGSFASTDVGKRIVGNGGEAVLTATDGSYSVVTAFNDSSTIASGSWWY